MSHPNNDLIQRSPRSIYLQLCPSSRVIWTSRKEKRTEQVQADPQVCRPNRIERSPSTSKARLIPQKQVQKPPLIQTKRYKHLKGRETIYHHPQNDESNHHPPTRSQNRKPPSPSREGPHPELHRLLPTQAQSRSLEPKNQAEPGIGLTANRSASVTGLVITLSPTAHAGLEKNLCPSA